MALALLASIALAGCPHGAKEGHGDEAYRLHERAVADFQRDMATAQPGCASLCQSAVAACETSGAVCDDGTPEQCKATARGCDWVKSQLPVQCGRCGLGGSR